MPTTQKTNPPTFDSVWADLQETAQIVKENAESLKETERLMKESDQRQEKKNAEFYEKLGHLTNLFGDLTEGMIAPKICEKFNKFGFSFLKAGPNPSYTDEANGISFEVDIMLENSDKAMLIEVKTKLTEERIDKHIQRLEKMRKYADLHGDKRTFLGAVAGIVVTDEIKKYALSKGLYFIEYAGETFYITPPGGEPREW